MKWYDKFKVGQEVRVTKITPEWDYGIPISWNVNGYMNKTLGKTYKILAIDKNLGYCLDTSRDAGYSFWYPVDSLGTLVGEQLEFAFME